MKAESIKKPKKKPTPPPVYKWKGDYNTKAIEILHFAAFNNLVISPVKGYDYYIENYKLFGCCACDAKRQNCPCKEAVSECATQGYCKCRLFWKDHLTFAKKFLKEGVAEKPQESGKDEAKISKETN